MAEGKYTIKEPSIYRIGSSIGEAFTKITFGGSSGRNIIELPLPTTLDYAGTYSWSAEALGHIADTFITSANKHWNEANGFLEGNAAPWKALNDMITSDKVGEQTARMLAVKAFEGLTGTAQGKEFFKQKGLAYNPNERLYFEGVPLREFSLSFDITPLTQDDSNQFAESYYKIRNAAAPSITENKIFFTYPEYFNIEIKIKDLVIMTRTNCALVGHNCNLAPNGAITWGPDYRPTSYSLELSFHESEVMTKGKENSIGLLGYFGTSTAVANSSNSQTSDVNDILNNQLNNTTNLNIGTLSTNTDNGLLRS